MHPYSFHYHRPSRVFWFILGAASAALWIKHRERVRADGYGYCIRQRQIAHGSPSTRVDGPTPGASTSADPLQTFGEKKQLERWEEDKAKMKDLTLKATDTIAEMSESTLDALLANLEGLKAKIVEHRSQRDKQRGEFDAKREADN